MGLSQELSKNRWISFSQEKQIITQRKADRTHKLVVIKIFIKMLRSELFQKTMCNDLLKDIDETMKST